MDRRKPYREAIDTIEFIEQDTLLAANQERVELGLKPIIQFIYAIEGLKDCYKSEELVSSLHSRGRSADKIQEIVRESGSSCIVTLKRLVAIDYLTRCFVFGNADISLYDFHSTDSALLYVTWTNMPT